MVDPKRTAATPAGKPRPEEGNPATTPQRDDARDEVPAKHTPPDPAYRQMKLPHEQDESAVGEAAAGSDPTRTRRPVEQAQRDVASGQQDTDCYDAVAPRYDEQDGRDDSRKSGR